STRARPPDRRPEPGQTATCRRSSTSVILLRRPDPSERQRSASLSFLMLDLTRSVRFCINDGAAAGGPANWGSPDNTFAAYPSMPGLGRFYELRVRCRGRVSPATGYFVNIKEIDQAVRTTAIPVIERACRERPGVDPVVVLDEFLPPLNAALGGKLAGVR